MISIVDYGLGNIQAFVNLYKRNGIEIAVAKTSAELERATKIILPGVGSFDHAIELLDGSGMRKALEHLVLDERRPVLGICVGMQILAERSDEGQRKGLGWIPGEVRSLKRAQEARNHPLPLPHMGWNDVRPIAESPLFKGLERDARFYFLHSFYFECASPESVAATCDYGVDFPCAVHAGQIFGVQFHPEKSQRYGQAFLSRFLDWTP